MNPSLLDRITMEPGKCGGRPCIRGQRIRVTDVPDLLGPGASHREILEDYLSSNKLTFSRRWSMPPYKPATPSLLPQESVGGALLEAFARILPSLKELLVAGDALVEIR